MTKLQIIFMLVFAALTLPARADDPLQTGFMTIDSSGRATFHTAPAEPGDISGFRIKQWTPGMLAKIRLPDGPWGLDLGDSGFTDDGISELAALPFAAHLFSLNISHTVVDDAGLKTLIAASPNLVSLNMFATRATDAGLSNLTTLTKLQHLNLGSVRAPGKKPLTDADMRAVGGLTTLRSLDLDAESVTDAGLANFSTLTELRVLDLPSTKVTGSGAAALQSCTKLETLVLAGDAVTDETVKSVATLTQLKNLNLDRTKITDAGLAELVPLTNLKSLSVTRTAVTEAAVRNWKIPVKWGPPAAKPAQTSPATQK